MKTNYKTVRIFLILSLVSVIFTEVYALFGHGVRSKYMNYMFLILLVGGAMVYTIINLIKPIIIYGPAYRPFRNIYNSGLSILFAGFLLKGILEIAGTDSTLISIYFMGSLLFFIAALLLLIKALIKK